MPANLSTLLETIHALRSPGGCPWDRKQTLASAAHHLLDEAAELVEATLENDLDHVAEELADLLFMVCFVCEILAESHPADLHEIARRGNEKLVRRHPHVFGDHPAGDAAESQARWNEVKAAEKESRGKSPDVPTILKTLPASAAPLHQAYIYQKNAAEAGFDWPHLDGVWEKIREEMDELRWASAQGPREAVGMEVGDLLFAVVNLARHLEVKPDLALRQANRRFRERFQDVEATFGRDPHRMQEAGLAALEAAWQRAKARLSEPAAKPDRERPSS
jgi:tetrapyrrole methylase family protein/MazG family protein